MPLTTLLKNADSVVNETAKDEEVPEENSPDIVQAETEEGGQK